MSTWLSAGSEAPCCICINRFQVFLGAQMPMPAEINLVQGPDVVARFSSMVTFVTVHSNYGSADADMTSWPRSAGGCGECPMV